jgi:hypothetical protein
MSEIATLHNSTLHFESEWLEKLDIGENEQVEINLLDGILVISKKESQNQSDWMSLLTLSISEMFFSLISSTQSIPPQLRTKSKVIQEEKAERKRMTIEEFDKYLEGKDLNELLHRARRRSEEWYQAHGIAELAASITELVADGIKYRQEKNRKID